MYYINYFIKSKEDINMDYNSSIGCTVSECRFHSQVQSYCTLNKIDVVKHEPAADSFECTDCGSFKEAYNYNLFRK